MTPCIHCGLCCRRTPCPLAIYLGERSRSCRYWRENGCSLVSSAESELKRAAAAELILSGKGCTHIYGPAPQAYLHYLESCGHLQRGDAQWKKLIAVYEDAIPKILSELTDENDLIFYREEMERIRR